MELKPHPRNMSISLGVRGRHWRDYSRQSLARRLDGDGSAAQVDKALRVLVSIRECLGLVLESL